MIPYILNAGDLRNSITIQAPVATPGSFGRSVTPTSWTTVRTTRAAISTAGGKEVAAAAQLVSDVTHVVRIRYTSTQILPGYRVLYGSRVLTVEFVENVQEQNRVLRLVCREVNGGV